jgi:S-DNA-T family DNA segregation ATPase FtsK/SpoIIIE
VVAVGDHVANDALLGQGAYSAGHRATELIPGTDRGTAVVKGFTGERSDIVQVYYLDPSHGSDQVTPIIRRSLAAIEARGALPGPAGRRSNPGTCSRTWPRCSARPRSRPRRSPRCSASSPRTGSATSR